MNTFAFVCFSCRIFRFRFSRAGGPAVEKIPKSPRARSGGNFRLGARGGGNEDDGQISKKRRCDFVSGEVVAEMVAAAAAGEGSLHTESACWRPGWVWYHHLSQLAEMRWR